MAHPEPSAIDRLKALRLSSPRANVNRNLSPSSADRSPDSRPDAALTALRMALAPLILPAEPVLSGSQIVHASHLEGFWNWFRRDVAPELAQELQAAAEGDNGTSALAGLAPRFADLTDATLEQARESGQLGRLSVQLGGEEIVRDIPRIAAGLRHLPLIERAGAFGRAFNGLRDDAACDHALASTTLPDPVLARHWALSAMGNVASPRHLFACIARMAGGGTSAAIEGSGRADWLVAGLIEAQRQAILLEARHGLYADIDLACKAIARFHSVSRAFHVSLDLPAHHSLMTALAQLTRTVSGLLDPLIDAVGRDVIRCLRPPREGADRLDPEAVLEALNGMYLLATARECRESLGVSATVERVWLEIGKSLELLVNRAMDAYRQAGSDGDVARRRLDAGLKMAALRYGAEYAAVLERSRDAIARRRGEV